MKKGKWKKARDKYWEGKSSLQEERSLLSEDSYFQRLEETKMEKLDWTFDDFLGKVKDQTQNETIKKRIIPIWKYVSAVAVLILIGFVFLWDPFSPQKSTDNTITFQEDTIAQDVEKSIIEPERTNPGTERMAEASLPDARERTDEKLVKKSESNLGETAPIEKYSDERPVVIVNGKPVYDDEAEEIIEASLYAVVANLREGKQAVEKIKHLKIKI